jgi:hypothetical protein
MLRPFSSPVNQVGALEEAVHLARHRSAGLPHRGRRLRSISLLLAYSSHSDLPVRGIDLSFPEREAAEHHGAASDHSGGDKSEQGVRCGDESQS